MAEFAAPGTMSPRRTFRTILFQVGPSTGNVLDSTDGEMDRSTCCQLLHWHLSLHWRCKGSRGPHQSASCEIHNRTSRTDWRNCVVGACRHEGQAQHKTPMASTTASLNAGFRKHGMPKLLQPTHPTSPTTHLNAPCKKNEGNPDTNSFQFGARRLYADERSAARIRSPCSTEYKRISFTGD